MTTYILGGGPTAMAVAHEVAGRDLGRFVLLERRNSLGGLAQTLQWAGVGAHDLGPHKIFTLDRELMRKVEALLPPERWLTREKRSSIFMHGRFLPYPPSPFSLRSVFGTRKFAEMVSGYAIARIRSLVADGATAATFEADLESRVGPALYQSLFRPIALKLWGDPRELDSKLSRGRVQTPSVYEIVARLLRLRARSDFEALSFRYPRGGLQELWKSIEASSSRSGEFLVQHEINGIALAGNKVTAIRYTDLASGRSGQFDIGAEDFVVSTLPLGALFDVMPDAFPPGVAPRARTSLVLNDLVLVFLHLDVQSLLAESWVFVPDPQIPFHRISEQESFDPEMTPRGSVVCCEIMSHAQRQMVQKSDAELVAAALEGVGAMGYHGFRVLGSRVIRLPKSYPVFRPGYQTVLEETLSAADAIRNFRSIGRQGAFNYIGTLDCMDIGYGFVRWLATRSDSEWQKERVRTGHYPVLD